MHIRSFGSHLVLCVMITKASAGKVTNFEDSTVSRKYSEEQEKL